MLHLRSLAARQRALPSLQRVCRLTTTAAPKASVAAQTRVESAGDPPPSLNSTPTRRSQRPQFDFAKARSTLPPDHPAEIRELDTFALPDTVTGTAADYALGKELVNSWRQNGILQIQFPPGLKVLSDAILQSKMFFAQSHAHKASCVDSQSFAGYIASGEELTDGIADYSEIFTVTKDLPESDRRVQERWPCHGPTPWPTTLPEYSTAISKLMAYKGEVGEKLLRLTALGLGLRDPEALTKLTRDGWHHMRVLRFPSTNNTNGKGKAGRGIGSHTDYGLLVIAAQDEVGGLFIRPPIEGEQYANWKTSAAGAHENEEGWVYVAPTENVFTVFPGDMMQFMTNSYLPSTPHKVGLNTRERYAFAYFHEPNFNAVCKRFDEFKTDGSGDDVKEIAYGSHFTNMFMRNYPERITAQRMREEKRMDILQRLAKQHGFSFDS